MKLDREQADRLGSAAFAEAFASDPELAELERSLFDHTAEETALAALFDLKRYRLSDHAFRPLTAAQWSGLWLSRNALAAGGEPDLADLDAFFYVLSLDDYRPNPPSLAVLPRSSRGFLAGLFSVDTLTQDQLDEAAELAADVIRDAFAPLSQLPDDPRTEAENPPADFGADWLAPIAILMHRCAGMSPQDAWLMPLSAVSTFCVAEARRVNPSAAKLRKLPASEAAVSMLRRARELVSLYADKPKGA
ncbi:MAG: hypothetical protein GX592_10885 [Clostridiales bacterium]|nr:hypothetical protein [Clostridiales bacterium]